MNFWLLGKPSSLVQTLQTFSCRGALLNKRSASKPREDINATLVSIGATQATPVDGCCLPVNLPSDTRQPPGKKKSECFLGFTPQQQPLMTMMKIARKRTFLWPTAHHCCWLKIGMPNWPNAHPITADYDEYQKCQKQHASPKPSASVDDEIKNTKKKI